jgi:stage II sporulation protein M
MTKIKQALAGYISDNIAIYLTVSLIFALGIVLGVFSVRILHETQIKELKEYLDAFLLGLNAQAVLDPLAVVKNAFTQNLKLFLLLWVLGITMVGIPAAIVILCLKGFTLGFTVSFIYTQFSYGGLMFVLGAVVPQNILIIPAFLTAAVASLSFSIMQVQSRLHKKSFHFWPNLWNYTAMFTILILILFMGSLVEGYITTVFIRLSVGIL